MTLNRRQFLAAGAALGATASIAAPTSPLPFLIQMQSDPLLPKASGKRVVICGGGWGGVTAAKHLRLLDPSWRSCARAQPGVLLVPDEQQVAGRRRRHQFLTFSYLDVAQRHTATTSSRPR
jgi:hypothetical protein